MNSSPRGDCLPVVLHGIVAARRLCPRSAAWYRRRAEIVFPSAAWACRRAEIVSP